MESNKIRINDRFSFEADEYNWILYDTHKYKSKKEGIEGQIVESTKTWYPSTLAYLAEWVINDTPKQSGSITDVLNAISQAKLELSEAIKQIPYKHTHG